jgi:hypothetical protein
VLAHHDPDHRKIDHLLARRATHDPVSVQLAPALTTLLDGLVVILDKLARNTRMARLAALPATHAGTDDDDVLGSPSFFGRPLLRRSRCSSFSAQSNVPHRRTRL